MKHIAALIVAGAFSASAMAAPVGETFTGVGVGVDLTSAKYKVDGIKGKQSTGPALVVDYGMDYGNNLVGVVQGKAKLGSTKVFSDVKQKNKYTVAYQQGYRVTASSSTIKICGLCILYSLHSATKNALFYLNDLLTKKGYFKIW